MDRILGKRAFLAFLLDPLRLGKRRRLLGFVQRTLHPFLLLWFQEGKLDCWGKPKLTVIYLVSEWFSQFIQANETLNLSRTFTGVVGNNIPCFSLIQLLANLARS